MANKVITVNRQYGSGGLKISQMAAERLGIACYDNEILQDAIEHGDLQDSKHIKKFMESDEKKPNSAFGRLLDEGNENVSQQQLAEGIVFELQQQVIKNIAKNEDAIIVGRCGNFALKDEDVKLLSVYIVGSFDKRVETVMEREDLPKTQAKFRINVMDRRRSEYYYHFTKQTWNSYEGYQVVLNSDLLGVEGCVNAICSLYEGL